MSDNTDGARVPHAIMKDVAARLLDRARTTFNVDAVVLIGYDELDAFVPGSGVASRKSPSRKKVIESQEASPQQTRKVPARKTVKKKAPASRPNSRIEFIPAAT